MRVAITTVQVPYVRGGGELLAEGLRDAVREAGHEVEIVDMPFRFGPLAQLERSIAQWREEPVEWWDMGRVDRAIHLKFPAYYAKHPDASLWLLHQHRAFYELWDQGLGGYDASDAAAVALRAEVMRLDAEHLAAIPRRYTIAKRVSERLQQYNGVSSQALYHPPFRAGAFYCGANEPYVFCPSRLETLKRQDLLVDAMARVKSPLVAVIAGEGGQHATLAARIASLDLGHRVRLVGRITHDEMLALYANCRAVFFGPYDEDYGYVTLEAMLASKPVVTCMDSGGPLEFVQDHSTGRVVTPDAGSIASALDGYAADPALAARHGRAGRERYASMTIDWQSVVSALLA